MKAYKWLFVALVLSCLVSADDLSDLRYDVFLSADIDVDGVAQLSQADVDSLISLECTDFHYRYPDALIKRDTLVLSRGVLSYDMPDDVLDVDTINPITFCIAREYRTNRLIATNYPLRPIPADQLYELMIAGPNATRPDMGDEKHAVAYSNGEMMVYPTPRFNDTLIYSYRAVQGSLLTDATFHISDTYYGRFVLSVVARVKAKLGLVVTP